MEIRAHYVAVGAFVLLMVALAFVTVLWLARGELRTQYARYDIYFTGPVTGLREGSIVEYNGVPVGKVLDVRIDPGATPIPSYRRRLDEGKTYPRPGTVYQLPQWRRSPDLKRDA